MINPGKENYGFSGLKGAQVGSVRLWPDAGRLCEAANRRFATEAGEDARKRFNSH
jgi:hypothetical protein